MKLALLVILLESSIHLSCAAGDIRSVEVGQAVPLADNSGDTWVSAWAKNGAVYTPSDDTEGFRKIGPGKLGMNGVVYLPELRRYFMIGWYYPAGGGKLKDACRETMWDFYQAPKPWGPWTRISSHRFSPQGYYSPQVCPKFNRDGGKSLFVFTAGDWNNPEVYRLTVVPITIRN